MLLETQSSKFRKADEKYTNTTTGIQIHTSYEDIMLSSDISAVHADISFDTMSTT